MSSARPAHGSAVAGVALHHPVAFWAGALAVVAGVLVHAPEFFAMGEIGYRMAGMPMTGSMALAMGLIVGGVGVAAYALVPPAGPPSGGGAADVGLRAMDDGPLTAAHWKLLTVLGTALVIDVMKPATIGFVLPGIRDEYGLATAQTAVLPLAALAGTTVGSLVWGSLADRIGRRASILLASLLFMGTAVCGVMPAFEWNVAMCVLMGISAGGMLPIVYALMAESVPAKQRGWLVVLHGGLGTVGGYLAASGLAALLVPQFGWRVLWLVGLPTGALMLVLNRWIPESPRFLLAQGRVHQAAQVMERFGVVVDSDDADQRRTAGAVENTPLAVTPRPASALRQLFRPPYRTHTLTVGLYGLAWGLVNWGFITFLPTILEDSGAEVANASRLLFLSALIAIPGTVVVACLYGRWSSKKSMTLYAGGTAAALVGLAASSPVPGGPSEALLSPLVVLLLLSSGGMIAMLSPYTAEVYPTVVRGTSSGLAAGASKVGGIFGPPLVAGLLVLSPGFTAVALAAAAPMAVAAAAIACKGVETLGRPLEDSAAPTGAPLVTDPA